MSDDPRYPVGRFQSSGVELTDEQRTELIDSIAEHSAHLRAAVAGLTDEQLDTPYRDGGWTVRQVVHHVVDSHLNAYQRFKLAVLEDHPTVRTYEQTDWAECAEARTAPVEVSLRLLDALHERWLLFLRSLGRADFRRTMDHPEVGDMTVDALLELYGWHGRHHTAHVTRLRERRGW